MAEANHVGVSFGGSGNEGSLDPIKISAELIRESAKVRPESEDGVNVANEVTEENQQKLLAYLISRLNAGARVRNQRIKRFSNIDRAISTWQKLSLDDSERERIEEKTGKQSAISMNLPMMATHLADMTSYFSEALAPVSSPFFSADGKPETKELLTKFNRDAQLRDYYGNVVLTVRSLLKYNIGGFHLEWDDGQADGRKVAENGNKFSTLNMYNTLWDTTIKNPTRITREAEWAATVDTVNRITLMRKALAGEWFNIEDLLAKDSGDENTGSLYKNAAKESVYDDTGADTRSSPGKQSNFDWGSYGLGLVADSGTDLDGFEIADMYCWLVPEQFGLLDEADRAELTGRDINPKSFLELWRFKIIAGCKIVYAAPALERSMYLEKELAEIPFYVARMTQDQLEEAQRSIMELMKGFQRFGSAMYNIYIAGMRRNVWGVTGIDPSMFDPSKLKDGDPVAVLESKIQGRDVRSGLMRMDSNSGVESAMNAVAQTISLKDQMFPSQAAPNQVGGIDRAIKSQVATVMQGATRALRTILRVVDSSLMGPTRLGGFRNLKRYDKEGIEAMTDEQVAKMLGSGIESMESERVSDILWQLMYAIIQNQEAMQVFDVPKMMTYNSRVSNLGVDLGEFTRQPPPTAPPGVATDETSAEAQPGAVIVQEK